LSHRGVNRDQSRQGVGQGILYPSYVFYPQLKLFQFYRPIVDFVIFGILKQELLQWFMVRSYQGFGPIGVQSQFLDRPIDSERLFG
jgi:hypothetical protein